MRFCWLWFFIFAGIVFSNNGTAAIKRAAELPDAAKALKPKIIIVLDDIGYKRTDARAFSLPVQVAFSILPQTPFATEYATLAHAEGRDVMLHLPMSSSLDKALGPAALTVGMYEHDIQKTLAEALRSVPYVVGVNNHMGSALTEQSQPMYALMRALKERSLFFLDSRTSSRSVAFETAKKIGLKTDKRHIFLDHEQNHAFYEQQFTRLVRIAKQYGRAIGIAHPYPSSMQYLSMKLADLDNHGVVLQPISDYFAEKVEKRGNTDLTSNIVVAPSE